MKKMTLGPTEYFLGKDLFDKILSFSGSNAVVICDEAVERAAAKLGLDRIAFPGGEAAKTRQMKEEIEDELLKRKYGRDTTIIAFGGGVAIDLAGFVASTYLRGVPLILAPTTLLAMVDAAIGGKTGVDTPLGKNLIGTFYPPKAIFADLNMLKTLPEKQWLSGLAEIWKSALIFDASIWSIDNWRKRVEEIIEKAAKVKIEIVQKDPKEEGLRKILNFGHTVGHALETLSDYQIGHGEAVALGTVVESYLSFTLGHLPKKTFEEIQARYEEAGFPLKLPGSYDRKKFLEAMSYDKKRAGKAIRFVLIDRIGHALPFDGEYCQEVSNLKPMIEWMEKQYG